MAAAEVLNISQPVVSGAPESSMISTVDLWKTYDMGSEQQVHALRGDVTMAAAGERSDEAEARSSIGNRVRPGQGRSLRKRRSGR